MQQKQVCHHRLVIILSGRLLTGWPTWLQKTEDNMSMSLGRETLAILLSSLFLLLSFSINIFCFHLRCCKARKTIIAMQVLWIKLPIGIELLSIGTH